MRNLWLALTVVVVGGVGTPLWAAVSVTVLPDRIVVDPVTGEFIPRFATYLPNSLTVPVGATVTLPADATHDAIEVAGTLRCARDRETKVQFIHLMILPGGTLDCGTADDPVRSSVSFIVRDVPIDTTRDPWQFGNGIINLGRQTRVGVPVTHVANLIGDAAEGETSLALVVPADWKVGDELLLPDFRQISGTTSIRREAEIFIASIGTGTIGLSKPLDFEHAVVRDPDGVTKQPMRVANLTRSFVVSSQNALGTRGHTINVGHGASWDIRYNALIGLGRTRPIALDNTKVVDGAVTHVGTNQVGRYTAHDHHTHDRRSGMRGSVLVDTPGRSGEGGLTRWGYAVHGTHDVTIEDNIALDFVGAGFVTEDGYEVRNVFRRNVAAYTRGNGGAAVGNVLLGAEGSGFWFHGMRQVFDGNESWNNVIGFQLFYMDQLDGMVPSAPGGLPDTAFNSKQAVPISYKGNRAISNRIVGLEVWSTPPKMPINNLLVANNGAAQVLLGSGIPANLKITNFYAYAQGGVSNGIQCTSAYHNELEIDGGEIRGTNTGVFDTMFSLSLRNVVLQNRTNVDLSVLLPVQSTFDNVSHRPLGDGPKQYLVLLKGQVWPGTGPFPRAPRRFDWWYNTGTRVRVTNWQGTGQHFLLFPVQSLRNTNAWPSSSAAGEEFFCPESGLTMGECWDRYGMGFAGGVVADSETVPLEGLINGVGRPGASYALGVPRTVMTSPRQGTSAVVRNGTTKLAFLLTGDRARATETMVVQIDALAPVRLSTVPWAASEGQTYESPAITPGTHRVVTWREDAARVKIAGSELTFAYVVGATTPSTAADQSVRGLP